MGFGNGLSIDKRIYDKFEPYLNKYINIDSKPVDVYKNWQKALEDMINDNEETNSNIRDVIIGTAIGDIVDNKITYP